MSPLRISSICFAALATTFLTGCVNPYATHYVAEKPAGSLVSVPSTSEAPPKIIESSHLHADILRLQAQGYVILGHSAFQVIDNAIFTSPVKQAKAVGAEIVLLKSKDLGTTQEPDYMALVMTGSDSEARPIFENQWFQGVSYETYRYVAVFLRRQTSPVSPK